MLNETAVAVRHAQASEQPKIDIVTIIRQDSAHISHTRCDPRGWTWITCTLEQQLCRSLTRTPTEHVLPLNSYGWGQGLRAATKLQPGEPNKSKRARCDNSNPMKAHTHREREIHTHIYISYSYGTDIIVYMYLCIIFVMEACTSTLTYLNEPQIDS